MSKLRPWSREGNLSEMSCDANKYMWKQALTWLFHEIADFNYLHRTLHPARPTFSRLLELHDVYGFIGNTSIRNMELKLGKNTHMQAEFQTITWENCLCMNTFYQNRDRIKKASITCLTISYHVISYHITSYHIISHHIISYHIISYHIISHHIISTIYL